MALPTIALPPRVRRGVVAAALVAFVLAAAGHARAGTGTITLVHETVPSADATRIDLAVDGATVGTDVPDGGAIGPLAVDSGPHAVSAAPGAGTTTTLTTTVRCVDGDTTLVDASPPATIDVAEGATVVCTFTTVATAVPTPPPATVVAPPTPIGAPILLPPVMVRGIATLRGPEGCTSAAVVRSRVTAVNALVIRFYRDGRLVRTIRNGELERLVVTLPTRLARDDLRLHVVTVRVRFITGAQPQRLNLVHRFGHCRRIAVTG